MQSRLSCCGEILGRKGIRSSSLSKNFKTNFRPVLFSKEVFGVKTMHYSSFQIPKNFFSYFRNYSTKGKVSEKSESSKASESKKVSEPKKTVTEPKSVTETTTAQTTAQTTSETLKVATESNEGATESEGGTIEIPLEKETQTSEELSKPPESHEKIIGESKKHEFQTETKKILDIVIKSLYTDKEVFVREIISNCSDALEKMRHTSLTGSVTMDPNENLEINVYTDPKEKTITIQDNGIGMTEKELITNLGRIGHSGSAEFLKNLAKDSSSIIGQFGVGFYSAFMVANKVTVYSKSALPGSKGYCWTSDGTGSYDIAEAEGVSHGTKIIISLNSDSLQFAESEEIESIIKKYSNFVGFNIKLNGKQVNTIKAIWALSKDQVSEKDHNEFFKFISHSYTDPLYHMHYATDSPISIRALFYVPKQNPEKFGMGRTEPSINLFSRKVLIQQKAKEILPDFLRFVKGVVDSEDLPLNISREFLQDSSLIKRIKSVLTKRILKWFDEESRKDPKTYEKFFLEFGNFLKEGIVTDFGSKEDLGKLLRFESSNLSSPSTTSLDEYISRMPPEQKEIYYLCAPSRSAAESSPYYEGFKAQNREVLFLYSHMDDFVMTNNLMEYKDKKIVSAEVASPKQEDQSSSENSLTQDEINTLIKWMKGALEGKVSSIKSTNRLVDSPAIIAGHETTSYRRMMKYVDPQNSSPLPKQQLEINPNHQLIKKLFYCSISKPRLANLIAEQIYDNALVAAGLVEDARSMLSRMNNILSSALDSNHDVEIQAEVIKKENINDN